jgi:hypothetical protein
MEPTHITLGLWMEPKKRIRLRGAFNLTAGKQKLNSTISSSIFPEVIKVAQSARCSGLRKDGAESAFISAMIEINFTPRAHIGSFNDASLVRRKI